MSQVQPCRSVLICQYRSCQRQGAAEVLAAFEAAAPDGVQIGSSDCMGQCALGVTVRVMPDNLWYCRVQAANVPLLVEQHLCNHQPVVEMLHPRLHAGLRFSAIEAASAPETPPHARE